jgi:hypothetical protein
MMAVDPQPLIQAQQSWLPWWIPWAFSTVSLVITGLLGLVVSFGRDAWGIYRLKVDALETKYSTLSAQCITRDELRVLLDKSFGDMDVRRIQMHNHNAELLTGIGTRISEVKTDLADIKKEFKEDINRVHVRIDELKQ